MSNVQTCERGVEAESFISAVAAESAEIIAEKIPHEYRSAYLATYAAGLLLKLSSEYSGGHYV